MLSIIVFVHCCTLEDFSFVESYTMFHFQLLSFLKFSAKVKSHYYERYMFLQRAMDVFVTIPEKALLNNSKLEIESIHSSIYRELVQNIIPIPLSLLLYSSFSHAVCFVVMLHTTLAIFLFDRAEMVHYGLLWKLEQRRNNYKSWSISHYISIQLSLFS